MAVAVLNEIPGLTTEIYDAVNVVAKVEDDPPAGLVVHTCGPMEGGLRVFDVWETEGDYDRFSKERLEPAIAEVTEGGAHGPGPTGPPRREIYHLHKFLES